ncbi:SEFIR domain-containing protein [Nostoc sp.]|uniref:SEFIR domain-containing protein n=1 Tax=Nostoc sp. TaxID=1180 RepID=UPI002FFADDF4
MNFSSDAPKVFISYSHDSPEHKNQVLILANRLRTEGVDCNIDQYEESIIIGRMTSNSLTIKQLGLTI